MTKRKTCLHLAATSSGGHPFVKLVLRKLLSGYLSLTARKPETSSKSRFVKWGAKPKGRVQTYYLAIFFRKQHENERNWTWGKGGLVLGTTLVPHCSLYSEINKKESETFFRRQYWSF